MTECERIINKGVIDKSFLDSETRNEFYVDEQRKKIWMVELDLLLEFDSVCRKHGLTYFLIYGTLLGAIRHKGFIPWDDDIDVAMPRKDYEKFIKLQNEFKEPYFLQTAYTDNGYYYTYAKVRNSCTCGITSQFQYQDINWGLMLDVYPLDNVDIGCGREIYRQISDLAKDNSNYMRMSHPAPSLEDRVRIEQYSGKDPMENYENIQCLAKQSIGNDTGYVSMLALTLYPYERNLFKSKDFSEQVYVDFEGFSFPVPVGYVDVLKTLYGDYMKFPPIEEIGKWHSNVYMNADIPYKEYLERKRK